MPRPLDKVLVSRLAVQGVRAPLLAALVAAAACAPGSDAPVEDPPLPRAPDAAAPAEPAAPVPPGADRPETVEGTLSLEGMDDPATFRLYRSPDGFALPFSTYHPDDVVAEALSSGEGEAVRFLADFGGQRNESIHLAVSVAAEDLTAAEAEERARRVAEGLGRATPEAQPRYPWALASYAVEGDGTTAHVALGRHQGRYFHLVSRAPSEALDGWGPRVAHILREWRWADGSALGS